jgi:hypothetical protein
MSSCKSGTLRITTGEEGYLKVDAPCSDRWVKTETSDTVLLVVLKGGTSTLTPTNGGAELTVEDG